MLLSRSKVRVMALAAVGFATTGAGGLAFQAV